MASYVQIILFLKDNLNIREVNQSFEYLAQKRHSSDKETKYLLLDNGAKLLGFGNNWYGLYGYSSYDKIEKMPYDY